MTREQLAALKRYIQAVAMDEAYRASEDSMSGFGVRDEEAALDDAFFPIERNES